MAPLTKKAFNHLGAVVPEPLRMRVKQQDMFATNAQRAALYHQVGIAAQAFALAFAKLKIAEPNTQQDHPASYTTPFPQVAAE